MRFTVDIPDDERVIEAFGSPEVVQEMVRDIIQSEVQSNEVRKAVQQARNQHEPVAVEARAGRE